MLCGGIDGRKYDPLIVGRHFRRRALKKFDFDTIGVDYTSSERSWADRNAFQSWAVSLNNLLKNEDRRAFILLDNAPATYKQIYQT